MHMYAKKIGEYVRENYQPENLKSARDIEELGMLTDIMKDLTEYDLNCKKLEEEHTDEMDMHPEKPSGEWIKHHVKNFMDSMKDLKSDADPQVWASLKSEMIKFVQSM